jgi:hypothetical protein
VNAAVDLRSRDAESELAKVSKAIRDHATALERHVKALTAALGALVALLEKQERPG